MLLAVDIGNIHIVWGVYRDDHLLCHWRTTTGRHQTADEFCLLLQQATAAGQMPPEPCSGAVVASVVPSLTGAVVAALTRHLGQEPLVLDGRQPPPVKVEYETPWEIGPDRIANGVAAYSLYGGPVIVADFGTATVFDVVSADGTYLGGAVAPGLITSAEALYQRAARLRAVELFTPASAIGRSTAEGIRAGLILGWAGMADEMIDRIRRELGAPARAILTGEFGHMVWGVCSRVDAFHPLLTLEGLRIIHQRLGAGPVR